MYSLFDIDTSFYDLCVKDFLMFLDTLKTLTDQGNAEPLLLKLLLSTVSFNYPNNNI